MVEIILAHKIDGVIATNTTLNHDAVKHWPHGNESGGLSGEPLFTRSTELLKQLNNLLKGRLPLIGVGGIQSAFDAQEKLEAGAS